MTEPMKPFPSRLLVRTSALRLSRLLVRTSALRSSTRVVASLTASLLTIVAMLGCGASGVIVKEPLPASSAISRFAVVGLVLDPRTSPNSIETVRLAMFAGSDQQDSKGVTRPGGRGLYDTDLMLVDSQGQGFRAWHFDQPVEVLTFVSAVASAEGSFDLGTKVPISYGGAAPNVAPQVDLDWKFASCRAKLDSPGVHYLGTFAVRGASASSDNLLGPDTSVFLGRLEMREASQERLATFLKAHGLDRLPLHDHSDDCRDRDGEAWFDESMMQGGIYVKEGAYNNP